MDILDSPIMDGGGGRPSDDILRGGGLMGGTWPVAGRGFSC